MLRRFLLGALVLSVASIAWAGVPDLALSQAVIDAAAVGATVYVLPNGAGPGFDSASAAGGGSVDATITLTLLDDQSDPIFGFPFEDLWLETSGGGLVSCPGGVTADGSTDIDGVTTWSNPPAAGGVSVGETTKVYVAGSALTGAGLDLVFKSADMNGDLVVNLSDIVVFTPMLTSYNEAGDYNNDGDVDLSDIVRFTPGIGASCN